MVTLYLASQSPRRRELLTQIGVRVELVSVTVPEVRKENEQPMDYVARLSLAKARAGYAAIAPREDALKPVLGADTIVVIEGDILEKPRSEAEGVSMLRRLSGQKHHVMTAVSLCTAQKSQTRINVTAVYFRAISDQEIDAYWRTGEPCDKAGGYGIQGMAAVFVDRIEGSYSSVVGLPLLETAQLLSEFNLPVMT